jgi:hypothetical protein
LRLARQYFVQVAPAGPNGRNVDQIIEAAQKDANGARTVEDVLKFWLTTAGVKPVADTAFPTAAELVKPAVVAEKFFPEAPTTAIVDVSSDDDLQSAIDEAAISPISIVDVNAASAYYANLSELKRRLLGPTDILDIKGRTFVKKSGWRKLAFVRGHGHR